MFSKQKGRNINLLLPEGQSRGDREREIESACSIYQ